MPPCGLSCDMAASTGPASILSSTTYLTYNEPWFMLSLISYQHRLYKRAAGSDAEVAILLEEFFLILTNCEIDDPSNAAASSFE